MIIMAIDHVRVYSGLPAGGPTAGIFFTRWITHYCAPAFVFFAGTSAFLYFQRTKKFGDVAMFLVTRGLLLVFLELTVIRFFWMFNFDYGNFAFTGVIWMLGWCMVFLPLFLKLRTLTLTILGLAIIFLQQIFQYTQVVLPEFLDPYWAFFYPPAAESTGSGAGLLANSGSTPKVLGLSIFYVIIPWIGLMMSGYGFGQLLLLNRTTRRKICLSIGLTAILLFVIVATILIVTGPENDTPFVFRLLGQQKYPPSQLFLLMTIGPIIALVPWAEKAKGWFADVTIIIGRVPMFFYLLHILLIHLSAFVVNMILFGAIHQDWYESAPFVWMSEDVRWGLPLLYTVWLVDIVILFFACKWYERFKREHPEQQWTKYL